MAQSCLLAGCCLTTSWLPGPLLGTARVRQWWQHRQLGGGQVVVKRWPAKWQPRCSHAVGRQEVAWWWPGGSQMVAANQEVSRGQAGFSQAVACQEAAKRWPDKQWPGTRLACGCHLATFSAPTSWQLPGHQAVSCVAASCHLATTCSYLGCHQAASQAAASQKAASKRWLSSGQDSQASQVARRPPGGSKAIASQEAARQQPR